MTTERCPYTGKRFHVERFAPVTFGVPAGADTDSARAEPGWLSPLARAYVAAPHERPGDAYHAWQRETRDQYAYLTGTLGVRVSVVERDPYPHSRAMAADLQRGRLSVLATAETGGHPLGDRINDMFRAVHDAFGHGATGRGFDRHGETAAYRAHREWYSERARPALATETVAQSATLVVTGRFHEQKTTLIDPTLWQAI